MNECVVGLVDGVGERDSELDTIQYLYYTGGLDG